MTGPNCHNCGADLASMLTDEEIASLRGKLHSSQRKVKTGGRKGRPAGAKDKKPRKGITTK